MVKFGIFIIYTVKLIQCVGRLDGEVVEERDNLWLLGLGSQ